jgi:hypothetical protein
MRATHLALALVVLTGCANHAPPGPAGAVRGGVVGAASGGALGAIGGVIAGAIQGGIAAAAGAGGAIGAALGAITGSISGARSTDQGEVTGFTERALPSTRRVSQFSAIGYVYDPGGTHTSLEALLVDEDSGAMRREMVTVPPAE